MEGGYVLAVTPMVASLNLQHKTSQFSGKSFNGSSLLKFGAVYFLMAQFKCVFFVNALRTKVFLQKITTRVDVFYGWKKKKLL
jgi:hypothetical protein